MFPWTDKTYRYLKWIAAIVLPAVTAAIITLGGIWGLPYYEQIAQTVAALNVLIGALVGISTGAYNAAQNAEKDAEKPAE